MIYMVHIFEKYLSNEQFFINQNSMAKLMNYIGNQPSMESIQKLIFLEALSILEKLNIYNLNYMTIM